jgi:glycine/D-amino acid oxidase-like deaminating enzyme
MGPAIAPTETDDVLPSATDVAIVGGGIIGASAALSLAMRGVSCVVLEKGQLAGEQSSRNWGWVRKMGRDLRELPLMLESEKVWRGLNAVTGTDLGYRAAGIAYLCATEAELAKREEWLSAARDFQLDSRIVSGNALREVFPDITAVGMTALYTPSDGRAEPQKAVPAIAATARALGAKVFVNCAVRTVERAAGRVHSVVTERGEIECNAVLLAGGAWSSLFCGNMGLRLPQLKVQASVARTTPLENGPVSAALGSDFSFRKREGGGYTVTKGLSVRAEVAPDSFRFLRDFLPLLSSEWRSLTLSVGNRSISEMTMARRWSASDISPFERTRTLDPEPVEQESNMLAESLIRTFPCFAQARIVQHWAGLIDVTPDVVPVISPIDDWPGFFVATGFSGHGFGIGPGAGRLAADLVTGAAPVVDPGPFRFARFSDGSCPRPRTGI